MGYCTAETFWLKGIVNIIVYSQPGNVNIIVYSQLGNVNIIVNSQPGNTKESVKAGCQTVSFFIHIFKTNELNVMQCIIRIVIQVL